MQAVQPCGCTFEAGYPFRAACGDRWSRMLLVSTIDGPLWSERQGRGPQVPFDHDGARKMFAAVISEFEQRGWFQEWFGYNCGDDGFVAGRLGEDVEGALLVETGRSDVWPVMSHALSWDDDTLFDMVEFLYRCVSAGIKETGRFHSFSGCGWHFNHFDQHQGRVEYRNKSTGFSPAMAMASNLHLPGKSNDGFPSR